MSELGVLYLHGTCLPMQNSMLDLEQSLEPSSWSLLTISDCNLCALLSMVQTSESTKALLTQLTGVLDQNVQRASTLEEAIEMNNNGLPEDMFKDTRSRKTKIGGPSNATAVSGSNSNSRNCGSSNKKDMEPLLQVAMNNLSSDGQGGESSKMAMECGSTSGTSISTVSTPTSTPISTPTSTISLDSTQKALNVLSKSAHIIVCCQKPGSLSCILTVPTSSTNSTSSIPTPIPTPGRRILPSPANGVEPSSILNKLSGLIKKTSDKYGKGSSKMPVRNPPQSESSKASSVSDYDAEKFSKFANILVNMDGIDGLQIEDCSNEEVPSNLLNQQQLQQVVQSRVQLLTNSGSDAEFTDSLESENSVTHQAECVEDPHDKMMDFASIVSSAVGTNSDQMSVEHCDHADSDSVLPLLPEVPMSWLKIPTSIDQQTSESMEATENDEVLCTPTQTSSSDLSSTTTTTIASVDTTSNDVLDVRIANRPLPSSSESNSNVFPRPPPPQPNPTLNGENRSTKDHQSAIGTQVHGHAVDQPMTEAEPRNNSVASDNFLNVSLDLDAESLQQLLALSRSPESHHSSNHHQLSHSAISTDTAPLSPLSQLFDKLEPARITSPGAQLDLSDAPLANSIHEQRCDDSNENLGHSHTDFTSHTHLNSQQSVANYKTQGVLGQENVGDIASTWTPSPNSLQLWLESTSGKCYLHISPPPVHCICIHAYRMSTICIMTIFTI